MSDSVSIKISRRRDCKKLSMRAAGTFFPISLVMRALRKYLRDTERT
jgi:hypothetical protein